MASGYNTLLVSPEVASASKKNSSVVDSEKEVEEKSQLPPDDSDDEEDLLIGVTPEGYSDDSIKTFVFKKEGHTLGTTLRDQLLKYPEVQFAGYSIPHPSDNELHVRIQTVKGSGALATAMLKRALKDIVSKCEHVEKLFQKELEGFPEVLLKQTPRSIHDLDLLFKNKIQLH